MVVLDINYLAHPRVWILYLNHSIIAEVQQAPLPALVLSFNDDYDLTDVWILRGGWNSTSSVASWSSFRDQLRRGGCDLCLVRRSNGVSACIRQLGSDRSSAGCGGGGAGIAFDCSLGRRF